jgi:YVTN family beta-propeller protein
MKNRSLLTRIFVFATLLTLSMALTSVASAFAQGTVVVANRGSKSISVIDVKSDTVIGTYPLPDNGEPMYIVSSPRRKRVFVGDRANDWVVVFRRRDFSVETTVPAGDGVFHMWADPTERQLWVVNDVDKTLTVINTKTLAVITTIPTPADLVAAGGRPHDVILDPVSRFAYITMIGLPGPDVVVQYSTATFAEVGRTEVGEDPHLSLARQNHLLYAPCQNTGNVFVLDRDTLAPVVPPLTIPGAHGAGMARNGKTFYTTNISGGGVSGLVAIDTDTNVVLGATDTGNPPIPTPHNIALTPDGKKLYVTHSGAMANQVTVYTATRKNLMPVFSQTVTVGLNPFGIVYVP